MYTISETKMRLYSKIIGYFKMLNLIFLGHFIVEWRKREKDLHCEKLEIFSPVVMIADLIAAGLHKGYSVLNSPTMPEM